jgi:uncharacterized protein YjbI with pentapeptide repeats
VALEQRRRSKQSRESAVASSGTPPLLPWILALVSVAFAIAAIGGVRDTTLVLVAIAGLLVVGTYLALSASDRTLLWGDLGRSFLVGALISGVFAFYAEEEKEREQQESFELTISLQQDLRGADLTGKDLSNVQLAGKNLSDADLSDATLEGANLIRTNLRGARLLNADLNGAILRVADAKEADFSHASLESSDLDRANLVGARLFRADLSGARLQTADLRDACLASASLIDADLTGANLHGAQLRNADLRAATFSFDLRFAALDADDTGQGTYLQSAGLDDVKMDEETRLPPGIDETEVAKSVPPRAGEPPPSARLVRATTVTDGDTLRLDGKPSSLSTASVCFAQKTKLGIEGQECGGTVHRRNPTRFARSVRRLLRIPAHKRQDKPKAHEEHQSDNS